MLTRRQALQTTALASAALAAAPTLFAQSNAPAAAMPAPGPFTLPKLPYAYDALEPFIDAQTMTIHHDKHHAAYVAGLNKAFTQIDWSGPAPDFGNLEKNWLTDSKFLSANPAIRNHGGGHYNHSLFWQMMKPKGGGEPSGELANALTKTFGAHSLFKQQFTEAATKIFGSGWAWLVLDDKKELKIETTPNQDTPLSSGKQVLLGLDVWEHAYYLKYQNKRADYIAGWWNVVNWDFVASRFQEF